jgi:hypothetical protein
MEVRLAVLDVRSQLCLQSCYTVTIVGTKQLDTAFENPQLTQLLAPTS